MGWGGGQVSGAGLVWAEVPPAGVGWDGVAGVGAVGWGGDAQVSNGLQARGLFVWHLPCTVPTPRSGGAILKSVQFKIRSVHLLFCVVRKTNLKTGALNECCALSSNCVVRFG